MDRFVQTSSSRTTPRAAARSARASRRTVMGYFDGNTVTALWNYAQHFALSDNSFGTTFGPSTPGALNLVAGRRRYGASRRRRRHSNVHRAAAVYRRPRPAASTTAPTPAAASAAIDAAPNVGDLLTAGRRHAGAGSRAASRAATPWTSRTAVCDRHRPEPGRHRRRRLRGPPRPFQYFASTANPHHLPPSSDAAIGHDDQANHQYDLADFWTARRRRRPARRQLPQGAGLPGRPPGAELRPARRAGLPGRDAQPAPADCREWPSTAVVLAWDDSDGWYDHQFPPNVHHSHNAALDTLYGVSPAGGDPTTLMCMAPPGAAPAGRRPDRVRDAVRVRRATAASWSCRRTRRRTTSTTR